MWVLDWAVGWGRVVWGGGLIPLDVQCHHLYALRRASSWLGLCPKSFESLAPPRGRCVCVRLMLARAGAHARKREREDGKKEKACRQGLGQMPRLTSRAAAGAQLAGRQAVLRHISLVI